MNLETLRNQDELNKYTEEAEKSALLPAGWYESQPPLTITISDDQTNARLFGRFKLVEVAKKSLEESPDLALSIGQETTSSIFFDFTNAKSFGGRLLADARRAQTRATGSPGNIDEVLEYVTKYPIRARMYQGKPNVEKGYKASMRVAEIAAVESE